MHVDLLCCFFAAVVQVEAFGVALIAHGVGLVVIERDAGDSALFVCVRSIVQVDKVTARMAVQVTFDTDKIIAAFVGHEFVGAILISHFVFVFICVRNVEIGDVAMIQAVGVLLRLVEQVDEVAAGSTAGVQVVVDERPPLCLVGGFQFFHHIF